MIMMMEALSLFITCSLKIRCRMMIMIDDHDEKEDNDDDNDGNQDYDDDDDYDDQGLIQCVAVNHVGKAVASTELCVFCVPRFASKTNLVELSSVFFFAKVVNLSQHCPC